MRIAIVQEHVDARRGGAETSVLEMAAELIALGADVRILCAGWPPEDTSVPCRGIAVSGLTKSARTRAFVRSVDRVCRAERFDVVHAVTPCHAANVYQPRGGTYVETIRRNVEMASSPAARFVKRLTRRLNFRQQFLLGVERKLLSRSRPPFVAAISEYVRRQIESDFSLPTDRVRVIFNGVMFKPIDPSSVGATRRAARDRWGIPDDVPVALFVAHNFKLKGLKELILAAAASRTPGEKWHVVVAGRDRAAPYGSLATELGVAERFHFSGVGMPMVSAYAGADVLAHPTWYDPCSRVVLEALSAGLPVVTTSHNGAGELIEPGRTGFVIDSPANTSALAQAIARCLSSELRKSASEAAPAIRERVSMRRHARELLKLYDEAASQRT